MSERLPFWSDDFDMDLLKLIPDLSKEIGATCDITLWTLGHESFGRLNHPCVWNSHGAFVWNEMPQLNRDEHSWANINGCVTNDPVIECTWLELLRDQWCHSFGFILLPSGVRFHQPNYRLFETIMYHIRTWKAAGNIDELLGYVRELALLESRFVASHSSRSAQDEQYDAQLQQDHMEGRNEEGSLPKVERP